jgi:DNA-binding CsgD family transcriptional regulator
VVANDEWLPVGRTALAEGRWNEARRAFGAALQESETGEALFGLATALWWLGENHECVDQCGRAYASFRRIGDVAGAAQCAIWLAITYKANFANYSAANGWLGRADRLLQPLDLCPLHGWLWVARAYRSDDLPGAEELSLRAAELAQVSGDSDLELTALSQLGLIRVAKGHVADGFALLDEALAALLAGERSSLDVVVYACCDMLTACELVNDIERAAQWCEVADRFVATYGCPFLYAECRIYYGSVLAAKGRWAEAEREFGIGLRITEGTCPGLHGRALIRLAGLRIRQGRLEEADLLLAPLSAGVEAEAEEVLAVAALLLARGDAPAASRNLEQRLRKIEVHGSVLVNALDLLVDAHLAAGDIGQARAAAELLLLTTSATQSTNHQALAACAAGRVAAAAGEAEAATHLEWALVQWSRLGFPFEGARARFELGRFLAVTQRDVGLDQAHRAFDAFQALGATGHADRVDSFLRSLGVRARAGTKGTSRLTVREHEVLKLIGAGLSNPEIAARLYVSRKTAAHHVSSILAKLDLRNRAEAAVYAARLPGASHPTPVSDLTFPPVGDTR